MTTKGARERICTAGFGLLLLLGGSRPLLGQAAPFKIVVHSTNPAATLTRDQLGNMFLKRVTHWDGGDTVQPVDQSDDLGVRGAFSASVFRKPVQAIRSYWQQKIFSGRDVPPPEFSSDQAVLAYVRAHPNDIGYVRTETPVGGDCRTIDVK